MKLATLAASMVVLLSLAAEAQTTLCADPQAYCGRQMQSSCLQRLGAGVIDAADADCGAQLQAYEECLVDVAEQCGGAEPAMKVDLVRQRRASDVAGRIRDAVCDGLESGGKSAASRNTIAEIRDYDPALVEQAYFRPIANKSNPAQQELVMLSFFAAAMYEGCVLRQDKLRAEVYLRETLDLAGDTTNDLAPKCVALAPLVAEMTPTEITTSEADTLLSCDLPVFWAQLAKIVK